MVLETLSAILLGFPFFDKNEIIIDAHNRLLQTPEFTFQLNLMHIEQQTTNKNVSTNKQTSQQPEKNHATNKNVSTAGKKSCSKPKQPIRSHLGNKNPWN